MHFKYKMEDNTSDNFNTGSGRNHKVMIIALSTVFCVILIPLCTWIVFTFHLSGSYSGSIPEWQQDNFMIESIPGLRYHPKFPAIGLNQVDTLIYFDRDKRSRNYWTGVIDGFLQSYKNPLRPQNTYVCNDNDHPRDKVCNLGINNWYPCTTENNYDYHKSHPCVFLRFNEILNWVPEYYNDTNSLPEDMPNFLKEHIIEREKHPHSPVFSSA